MSTTKGKFVILNNGVVEEYSEFNDIPESFDNVISFRPDVPPPPHNGDEHEQLHKIGDLLQELMKRETK